MSNFKFIGYRATPNDQYGVLGIASVVVYGKVILRYKHVKKKDGNGDFFASASYGVEEFGSKTYMDAFGLDSRAEEEELLNFIRNSVKGLGSQKTALETASSGNAMLFTPFQTPEAGPAVDQGVMPF